VIPSPFAFVLLSLAAYRVWRLCAVDDITAPVRDRLTGRVYASEQPGRYRLGLDKFVGCPWCAGFWVAVAVWAVWSWQPHWTLAAAAPFAVSAMVGLIAKNLDA